MLRLSASVHVRNRQHHESCWTVAVVIIELQSSQLKHMEVKAWAVVVFSSGQQCCVYIINDLLFLIKVFFVY